MATLFQKQGCGVRFGQGNAFKTFPNRAWEVTVQGTRPTSDWLLVDYSLALVGPR